jgi:Fe-S oxidoreductase
LSQPWFPVALAIASLAFAWTISRRARLLVAARPANRLDRVPERVMHTLVYGLGQKKFLRGEQPAGIMHALIFWGFVVLLLQVITLFGRAFDWTWHIPGFGPDQPLGPPFFLARDLLEASVIVGVSYMLYRRLIVHTPRLFGIGAAEERYREAPEGRVEPMLQQTLENFFKQGNSYGKSARLRARWTEGLEFVIPDAREEPVDYVWFVGDFASFDERAQAASQRLARILHDAGVSFGLLYDGERNAGNDVRRIGEEGLFEMLVEQNVGELGKAQFTAIFTTDPHSLNTLRSEYPQFGLERPVYHYTELLAELVTEDRIELRTPLTGTSVTYHDPCYLARYNRITDAPRRLITATGARLIEMPRNGTNTFCCGAGGGRIWMDDSTLQERPSEQRIKEAQALGELDYCIVSCPKDLAMYSDAAKTVGAQFEVAELTALMEQAIGAAQPIVAAGVGERE